MRIHLASSFDSDTRNRSSKGRCTFRIVVITSSKLLRVDRFEMKLWAWSKNKSNAQKQRVHNNYVLGHDRIGPRNCGRTRMQPAPAHLSIIFHFFRPFEDAIPKKYRVSFLNGLIEECKRCGEECACVNGSDFDVFVRRYVNFYMVRLYYENDFF